MHEWKSAKATEIILQLHSHLVKTVFILQAGRVYELQQDTGDTAEKWLTSDQTKNYWLYRPKVKYDRKKDCTTILCNWFCFSFCILILWLYCDVQQDDDISVYKIIENFISVI